MYHADNLSVDALVLDTHDSRQRGNCRRQTAEHMRAESSVERVMYQGKNPFFGAFHHSENVLLQCCHSLVIERVMYQENNIFFGAFRHSEGAYCISCVCKEKRSDVVNG
jgi:hypothetical protein